MIYFLQPTDGGPVKIGCSVDVPRRVRQPEAHHGQPLAIPATIPGDREVERDIHLRFAHLRLDGRRRRGLRPEQFRPAPDLLEFIGRPLLVGPDPDAVEAMRAAADAGRDDITVKLDKRPVGMARAIATARGVSVAGLISEAAEVPIGKTYARMLRDLEAGKGTGS